MEDLILLLTASLVLYKKSRQFRRVNIGSTSCSVLYSTDSAFEFTRTEEGDELYFSEYTEKGITYGVLCARVGETLSPAEMHEVMATYVNRLRRPFNARHNTGSLWVDDGAYPRQATLVDYWQDGQGRDWKVKATTDGCSIAVLYVKNIADIAVEKQDAFLDSFSFGTESN